MKRVLSFIVPAVVSIALLVLIITVSQWFWLPYWVIGALTVKFYYKAPYDIGATLYFGLMWFLTATMMLLMCWAPPFNKVSSPQMFRFEY